LEIVQKGQKLFDEYKPYEELTFINPNNITRDNPKLIDQFINDDFQHYRSLIDKLKILTDWRKAFLFCYLNQLLTKLTGTQQPFNDDASGKLRESSSRPVFPIILTTPDVCSNVFAGMLVLQNVCILIK